MNSSMWPSNSIKILRLILCCGVLIGCCRAQGLIVIGPKLIRLGTAYTVVILSTLSQPQTFELSVKLTGSTDNNPTVINEHKIVRVQRGIVKSETFKVGNIPEGNYQLQIDSMTDKLMFQEVVELQYHNKTESIFVQLDKPMYKPGDIIHFRVIVVDVDTRPTTNTETVNITLIDGQEKTIMTWSGSKLVNGVFESWFQIASSPVKGTWKLKAIAGNSETIKEFVLKEYVLPKFFIKAKPAAVHVAATKQVKLIIESSYIFGKPVKGFLTVELLLEGPDSKHSDYTTSKLNEGYTVVKFDLAQEFEFDNEEHSREIFARVSVKENLSNQVESIILPIPVYRSQYVITMNPSKQMFGPGKPFNLQFLIKDRCETCSFDTEAAIIHFNEISKDNVTELMFERVPNTKGEINIEINSSQNASQLEITKVIYKNVEDDDIKQIHASRSKSNYHLKVTYNQKNYKIKPDQLVKFEINCTQKVNGFLYIFVSRGRIIDWGFIGKKARYFSYSLPKRMAPKAKLVVMFMKDNYLIYDDLDLIFDELDNKFKISLDPSPSNTYKPGQEVYVKFDAASDSYVAFHAIDQSVLHLSQSGHLLTRDDLIKELSNYDAVDENEFDAIHSMGLFLKTTAEVDSPHGDNRLTRFGQLSERKYERPIHTRTDFRETWLWKNYLMQGNTSREITAYIPDSITSWKITGFALSPSTGLNIIEQPLIAKVKQEFFIVANLPYSIKREEIALIQATIFNKLGIGLTADVKLYSKNNEIEFYNETLSNSNYKKKTVFVEHDSAKSVSFFIKAKKLGEIIVRIEAVALIYRDAVEHILRVVPESQGHEKNEARFIDLEHSTQREIIQIDIPRDIDPGSAKITFALDPNFLGTTATNLDNLLLMPTGCCEQVMIKLVPDIVILNYLDAIQTMNQELKSKAINFLKDGYSNLFQEPCRLKDGSFRIFGSQSNGSVFVTAFVAKTLKIADKYIDVKRELVEAALSWLAQQQRPDGKFIDEHSVFSAQMQGGIRSTSYALTAYVLAAFSETEEIGQRYLNVTEKSIRYLIANYDNMNHPYDLAVTAYAMSMSNTESPDFLKKLMDNSTFVFENTTRYWNDPAMDVEIASYALLAKLKDGKQFIDSTSIMRWLNSQRSSRGGFRNTQETFVGLNALAKYAEYANPARNQYTVNVKAPKLETFDVHRDILNVQKIDIDSSVRSLEVEVYGVGTGNYQISYGYQRSIFNEKSSFKLEVNVLNTTTYDFLHLKVCVAYESREHYNKSNMALVEVAFPSGIVATDEAVTDLSHAIQKTEPRYGGTSLVVYYLYLDANPRCFRVKAERRYKVALHRPAYVVVYDYYENHKTDKFAIKTYEGKILQPCEICEGEDCLNITCR